MKKIILTLLLFVLIIQANAQKSLKDIIGDERSGITNHFTDLQENEQAPFNLSALKSTLGLDPLSNLVLMGKDTDELGYIHYRFYQTYKGIPIENSMYIIHVKSSRITGMSGEIIIDFDVKNQRSPVAGISKQAAIAAALNIVQAKKYMWQDAEMEQRIKNQKNDIKATFAPDVQLVWVNSGESIDPHNLRLAYKVDVYAKEPLSRADYFIDAQNGKFYGKKDKLFYTDATGTAVTAYSGTVTIHSDFTGTNYRLRDYTKGAGIITLHGESGLSGNDYTSSSANWVLTGNNIAALDAHYGASQTYQFYRTVLGRNSYNNTGGALYSYVNRAGTDNAFWDGSSMNYYPRSNGNHGGVTGIDVCGHELTHGVTQYTSGLNYSYESGAMNESMSDIMGKSIQFYSKPSDINWKLSNDMGWIIRDMANPNAYSQPDTYKGTYWYVGSSDNGGVHSNSGVGNFMYYLLVNGGSGTNDLGNVYSVTGIGLTAAERIIYRTNAVYLTPTSKYADWRTACINAATDLYGAVSTQVTQVKNAWYAVGIGSSAGGNVYCSSTGTTTYEYIKNVKLGTINNTSGNNGGYGNYTALNTALSANTTYSIQLTPGFNSSIYTEYWTVYIDYNQNGKLNDPGEKIASGSSTSGSAISLSFKLPKNVLNGQTRMRVQMNYGSASTDPCATLTYGEVEDYSVIISGGINYCASSGSNTFYEYINKVALGAINNTSGNNFGYGNYTALSTNLTELFSYTISLTPGFTGSAYNEYWAVYIDFNRNGLFTDAGEEVATGSGTGAITKTFSIPPTASTGSTRMRVQMNFGSAPASPCSAFTFGEVEDYTVNILPPVIALPPNTSLTGNATEQALTKQTGLIKEASVSIIPNPVTAGNAKAIYTLDGNGPASLKLVDLGGRILKTISLGDKNAGTYTQQLFDIAGFKGGSYIIVLEQNGKISARNKIIVAQ